MKTLSEGRKAESGFTLVELAVVMIIIGLLIGGVLKGQEMIANARITSTIAQLKGIESATSTFRDMYDAMPGDLVNPAVRLPNCAAAPCSNSFASSGNSRMDIAVGAAQGAVGADEGGMFWIHLAAADLINGINSNPAAVAWGQSHPQADIGGGFTIGHTGSGINALVGGGTLRGGHYIAIQADPTVAVGGGGAGLEALTPSQAARIDRKMDDGLPENGTIQSAGQAACIATPDYNEAADDQDCSIYVRIQS